MRCKVGKKSLAQEVRQKIDCYFGMYHDSSSHQKSIEYLHITFFYRKLDVEYFLNIFLFGNIFSRNSTFRENYGKTVLEAHLMIFLDEEDILPQKLKQHLLSQIIGIEYFII